MNVRRTMTRSILKRVRSLIVRVVEWYAWGWGAGAVRGVLGVFFIGIGTFLFLHGAFHQHETNFIELILGVASLIFGLYLLLRVVIIIWFMISERRNNSGR